MLRLTAASHGACARAAIRTVSRPVAAIAWNQSARLLSSSPSNSTQPTSTHASAAGSSTPAQDVAGGAAFSTQQPPSPPRPPSSVQASGSARLLGLLIGGALGVTLAVKVVVWLSHKERAHEAAEARAAAGGGSGGGHDSYPASPPSHYPPPPPGTPSVAPLDYRVTPMATIFQSVLGPLSDFETHADAFVDRKAASANQVQSIAARRKQGPVPPAESKASEVEATRVAAEERTIYAPRLAYLRELYRVRSLELMQRSQYLGERLVAAAGSSELDALRAENQKEQAEFQQLARASQHLARIVEKYDLKGASPSARRMMQPTTEGGAQQQETE